MPEFSYFCLSTYGEVSWSSYVMLGIALLYIVAFLPGWFRRKQPLIFVPLDFAAVCGYLLYICLTTGGHWFLSFAFPVVMLVCLLTTAAIAMLRYIKRTALSLQGTAYRYRRQLHAYGVFPAHYLRQPDVLLVPLLRHRF